MEQLFQQQDLTQKPRSPPTRIWICKCREVLDLTESQSNQQTFPLGRS